MTLEEFANMLEAILDRITDSTGDDAKLQIRRDLNQFKRDLPWEPELSELRQIAEDASADLAGAINKSVLARMEQRTKALARYTEKVVAVTARAKKNIEELRLKHVKSVVAAANEVADAVRAIKASIKAEDLPAATEKTEKALDMVLKLIADTSAQA